MSKRGGRASSRLTQIVLETYGRVCWLRLPGCKTIATTKDHVIPVAQGGTDDLENLRPACTSCNSKRQDRSMYGFGASVVIVTGPPCGGKSTWIMQHAKPNDVVIDLDRLVRALEPTDRATDVERAGHVGQVAMAARKAAIARATRLRERITVWVVHSQPSPDDLAEYRAYGWHIETIDPGRATVEARARSTRPPSVLRDIARWYAQHDEPITLHVVPNTPPTRLAIGSTSPDW